nr:TPA_asm: hypothetical protein [Metorchi phenuili virus]
MQQQQQNVDPLVLDENFFTVRADSVKKFLETSIVTREWSEVSDSRKQVDQEGLVTQFKAETAELFRYEGFDPNYVYGFLVSRTKTKSELVDDVIKMSVVFLLRGNNIGKMIKSMSAEGAKIVEALRVKYSLADRIKGGDRRKTITLSRVCMTLPGFIMKAMIDLHASYVPAIRTSLDKLHCVLRLNVCIGYFKASWSDSAYLLSFMYAVALGAAIGGKGDTLSSLRKFVKAALDSPLICESETRAQMELWNVNAPPLNWPEIKTRVEMLLSPYNDDKKLVDLLPEIDSIMEALRPSPRWTPYIDPRFFRPDPPPKGKFFKKSSTSSTVTQEFASTQERQASLEALEESSDDQPGPSS